MTDEIKTTPEMIEVQDAPQAEPARAEPPLQGVGDLMKEGMRKAVASLVVVIIIAAYLAGLAYAEVHGMNMLRNGVAPDLLIWAYAGMFVLGALAIAFPLGLHFYAFDPTQRLAMYIFYFCVDLPLLLVNTFVDFGANTGGQLTQWAQIYKDYIMPSTPVIGLIMATIILLLDPHARALVMRQALRAAMMQQQANLIMKEANNAKINDTIRTAAAQEVDSIMTELFGRQIRPVSGYMMDTNEPPRRTALQSFFDGLSSLARRVLSENTRTQSQPPDSSNEPKQ